jgi:hypothetical protein
VTHFTKHRISNLLFSIAMLGMAAFMLCPYPHTPENELTEIEATVTRRYSRGHRSKSLWFELRRDDETMDVTCHAIVCNHMMKAEAGDDVVCLLDDNLIVAMTVNGEAALTYAEYKQIWDDDSRFWGVFTLLLVGVSWLIPNNAS